MKLPSQPVYSRHEALAIWREITSSSAPLPEGLWPRLEELIAVLVHLQRRQFETVWEKQLSAPPVALASVSLMSSDTSELISASANRKLTIFIQQGDGSWQSKYDLSLPDSGSILGIDPPLLTPGNPRTPTVAIRSTAANQPDKHYEIFVDATGKPDIRLRPQGDTPSRQILLSRRFGPIKKDGLLRLYALQGSPLSKFVLRGVALTTSGEIPLSFQPLSIAFNATRVFAGGQNESVLAWQWQRDSFAPVTEWPQAGVPLHGQVQAIALWPPNAKLPYILAATDERIVYVIDPQGKIDHTIQVPHSIAAIESMLNGLWLADQLGNLRFVQPAYAPLAADPLPELNTVLNRLPTDVRPRFFRKWLHSASSDLASAAARGLCLGLQDDASWARDILREFSRDDLVRLSPENAGAVVAVLEEYALSREHVPDPIVDLILASLLAMREKGRSQLKQRIDSSTGRVGAKFRDEVLQDPEWLRLDERRGPEPQITLSAQAERLIHRRANVWTFAADSPIRALLPLPDSTEALVATRAGNLFQFSFGERRPLGEPITLDLRPAIPRAVIANHLSEPRDGETEILVATLQGHLFAVTAQRGVGLDGHRLVHQLDPEIHSLALLPPGADQLARLVVGGNAGKLQVYFQTVRGNEWKHETDISLEADWLRTLEMAPFEPDQPPVLLAGGACGERSGVLYLINSATLQVRSEIAFPAPVLDAKAILADEARPPFIALACADGFAYLVHPDGREEWRYRIGRAVRNLEVFDLSKVGEPELIVGGEADDKPHVIVLGLDGTARWVIPTSAPVTHVKAVRPPGQQAHILIADIEHIVQVIEVTPPDSNFEREVREAADNELGAFARDHGIAEEALLKQWLGDRTNPPLQGYACYRLSARVRDGDHNALEALLQFDPAHCDELVQRAYARSLVKTATPCPTDKTTVFQVINRLNALIDDSSVGDLIASVMLRETTLPGRLTADDIPIWQHLLSATAVRQKLESQHAVLHLIQQFGKADDSGLNTIAWEILHSVLVGPKTDVDSWIVEDSARVLRYAAPGPLAAWQLALQALDKLRYPRILTELGRPVLPLLKSRALARALAALGELAQSRDAEQALQRLSELALALQSLPELARADDEAIKAFLAMAEGANVADAEEWKEFVNSASPSGGIQHLQDTFPLLEPENSPLLSQFRALLKGLEQFRSNSKKAEGLARLAGFADNLIERLWNDEDVTQGRWVAPFRAGLVGMLKAWARQDGVLDLWEKELNRPVKPLLEITAVALRPDDLALSVRVQNPSEGIPIEELDLRINSARVQVGAQTLNCRTDAAVETDDLNLEPQETRQFTVHTPLDLDQHRSLTSEQSRAATASLTLPVRYLIPPKEWKNENLTAPFNIQRHLTALDLANDLPLAWKKMQRQIEQTIRIKAVLAVRVECPPFARAGVIQAIESLFPQTKLPRLDMKQLAYDQHALQSHDLKINIAAVLAWVAAGIWKEAEGEIDNIRESGSPVFIFNRLADSYLNPEAIIFNNWDRLLMATARRREQWPALDAAVSVLFDWSARSGVRLIFIDSYSAEHVMKECWPEFSKRLRVVRLNSIDLADPKLAAELQSAVVKMIETQELADKLRDFSPPATAADIVQLSGGYLHCVELILNALTGLPRASAVTKSLTHVVFDYANATNFFSVLWMWQSLYARIALTMTAHGEIPLEREGWAELGFTLSRDYFARRPDGRSSRQATLRAGVVLGDVEVTIIKSNQYYRSGDAHIRGFAPENPPLPEWGQAGDTWLRLLRASERNGHEVLERLISSGIVRPRKLQHTTFYEIAVPIYAHWIIENSVWPHMLAAAHNPAQSWYPEKLAADGRPESGKNLLFPDRSCTTAHSDLPFVDLSRVDSFLDANTLPLFLTLYGLGSRPMGDARRRWRELVSLSGTLKTWSDLTSTTGEAEISRPIFDSLGKLFQLHFLLQGEPFRVHSNPDRRQTYCWTYAALGGGQQALHKNVIIVVLRDGDARGEEQTYEHLQEEITREFEAIHKGKSPTDDGNDAAEQWRERSVIFLIAPDPALALRRATPGKKTGPHFVSITFSELAAILLDPDPPNAIVTEAFDAIGRHAFSPYQLTGTLDGNSPLFVGREDELREITGALKAQNKEQDFVIVGSRRIGKTSLLRRVQFQLEASGPATHPQCFYFTMDSHSDEAEFYAQLKLALRKLGRDDLDNKLTSRPDGHFADLREVMQQLREETGFPVVWLIDEVDGLYYNDLYDQGERLFKFVRNNLVQSQPRLCALVMTGYQFMYFQRLSHASVFYNFGRFITLTGVDQEAVAQLVYMLRQFKVELGQPDEIVGRIARQTYAIPRFVQDTCDKLLKRIDDIHDVKLTPDDIQRVIESNVPIQLKFELWDDLQVDTTLLPPDEGLSDSMELTVIKLKIILLSVILDRYAYKLDKKLAHLPLEESKRAFNATQAIASVRTWHGDVWPMREAEVDRLLRLATMTLALAPHESGFAYTFSSDILPDVLYALYHQGQLELDRELRRLFDQLKLLLP